MTRFEIAISVAAGCVNSFAVIDYLFGLPAAAELWLLRLPIIVALEFAVCALIARRLR